MDKIATVKHDSDFQSQKFSVVGNVDSLVSSYNFVNQGTEGNLTTFDIEPVINFKYNTLPTSGLIRNIPYTCLYDGGNAGYPEVLGKRRTFDIITSVNNDKVFHRPGDSLYYSTQASGFTSPYFCVAVDNKFFSNSSELYPILLYAPVGTRVNDSGLIVKSFLCLSSSYVTYNNNTHGRILPSDTEDDLSIFYGAAVKDEGVLYTKQGGPGAPYTMFRNAGVNPMWFDSSGISSIWHFNPKMIDNSIVDNYGAYYTYSKYLPSRLSNGRLPTYPSDSDIEVFICIYHVLDFVFEGEPSPTFAITETNFAVTDKTYNITQDDYSWVMYRSSRNKFYVRYIQYKV